MSDLGDHRTGLDVLADRLADHIGETDQRNRNIEQFIAGVEIRIGDRIDAMTDVLKQLRESDRLILGELKTLSEYFVKTLDRVMALEERLEDVVPIQQAKRPQMRARKK